MKTLPLLLKTMHLEYTRVRVSSQCLRQKNYPHIHAHTQLCYVLSGTLKHTINGTVYIQEPNSCSFVLPYVPHMTDLIDSEDTPVVVFISFLNSLLEEHGHDFFPYGAETSSFDGMRISPVCEFSGEKGEAAEECIRRMIDGFAPDSASYMHIAELIAELFQISFSETSRIQVGNVFKRRTEGLIKAARYIEEHYAEKLCIEDMCRLAEMSRSTFTMNFKKITGLSFANFVLSARLSAASSLLTGSDMLLDEIASRTGLHNRNNLARTFQKYLGISPSMYRQRRPQITSAAPKKYKNIYDWLLDEEEE